MQRSCTSGPIGSVLQEPEKDPDASGRTGAWYRDLAQVVRQDPDKKDPHTAILPKCYYRTLIQAVQKFLQDPEKDCGSRCKDPDTEILHK